ncbi:MAG: hypothetical protein L0220_06425, partial [Acidobacteria bacterium]|nr:hypothetical protein [Acidobacteriota bacterium]
LGVIFGKLGSRGRTVVRPSGYYHFLSARSSASTSFFLEHAGWKPADQWLFLFIPQPEKL